LGRERGCVWLSARDDELWKQMEKDTHTHTHLAVVWDTVIEGWRGWRIAYSFTDNLIVAVIGGNIHAPCAFIQIYKGFRVLLLNRIHKVPTIHIHVHVGKVL
jgi:hypothetical protein